MQTEWCTQLTYPRTPVNIVALNDEFQTLAVIYPTWLVVAEPSTRLTGCSPVPLFPAGSGPLG